MLFIERFNKALHCDASGVIVQSAAQIHVQVLDTKIAASSRYEVEEPE